MTVDAYLASVPPGARALLERIREIALAAAPGATDVISYQMPALRFEDRVLVWYAAFAKHVSLFPASDVVRRAIGDELERYLSGKGTIRFELGEPLPEALVRRIVEARIAENRSAKRPTRPGPGRPGRGPGR